MPSYKNLADVFQGGATTSQHVDARDDEHFKNTSFLLKRTRSLGLLDDFIIPGEAKVKDDFVTEETVNKINQNQNKNQNPTKELKHRLPKINTAIPKQNLQKKNSILYNSDSSDDDSDEEEQDNYLPHGSTSNTLATISRQEETHEQQDRGAPIERSWSHSPPATMISPEFLPHDDNDLLYEPQRHVDYLSHDWKESDISKSWRYIVLKRKDVTNSARLENASWRTWAQLKNHLKTVSPESVNWLKESDVTWLYGPLYKEPSASDKSKKFTSDASNQSKSKENDSCEVKGPKPILKKRTAAEMMLSQLEFMKLSLMHNLHKEWNPHTGSPILEAISHSHSPPQLGHHDSNRTASPVSLNSPLLKTGSNMIDHSTESVPTSSSVISNSSNDKKKDRHIHFNDNVRQCIAIDLISDEERDYKSGYLDDYDDDEDSESSDDDDDDDKGGFCLNVRSPSSAFLFQQGSAFQQQEQQEQQSTDGSETKEDSVKSNSSGQYQTIALLPNTHLNYNSTDDEESEEEKEYTSIPFYDNRVSHNVNTNRNYDYHYNYDYNSIYPNNAEVKDIINNKDNDNLKLYDIPDNLDLGSIVQIDQVEDITQGEESKEFKNDEEKLYPSTNSNGASNFKRSNSGYNIKEQRPLPPFQSNTSVNGSGFSLGKEEEDDENSDVVEGHVNKSKDDYNSDNNNNNNNNYDDVNQRLQRISSSDGLNNNQYSKLSSKTKDLASLFLSNWKK